MNIKKLIPLKIKVKIRKGQRRLKLLSKRVMSESMTTNLIVKDFRRLGVEAGAKIVVHSSLRSLGYVAGGVPTVIAALKEVVGPGGLLCLPALSRSPQGGVGAERSVAQMGVFDALRTPSGVGAITEAFRKMPGVVRSIHPTHSLCALGPGADELIAGHELCQAPFIKGSPWEKMRNERFQIIMLGASIDSLTFAHVIEDNNPEWPLDVYEPEIYTVDCKDAKGVSHQVTARAHSSELTQIRHVSRLWDYFKALPGTREGNVGEAHTIVMNSDEVYQAFVKALADGHTMYGHLDDLRKFRKSH